MFFFEIFFSFVFLFVFRHQNIKVYVMQKEKKNGKVMTQFILTTMLFTIISDKIMSFCKLYHLFCTNLNKKITPRGYNRVQVTQILHHVKFFSCTQHFIFMFFCLII